MVELQEDLDFQDDSDLFLKESICYVPALELPLTRGHTRSFHGDFIEIIENCRKQHLPSLIS